MNKTFLFVFNPKSGNGCEVESIVEMIFEKLGGIQLDQMETTGEDDVSKIKTKLSEKNYGGILIGGGDGTIKMVVEAVMGSEIHIGIIPMGSANGLAKCLGISTIPEGISSVYFSKIKSLDYLDINGEICLHLSDFGFNAGLVKKFDEEDTRGMITYFKSTLKQFFEMKPYRFKITADGKTLTVEAKMLVIANGDKYGTGAFINPKGKMDDGWMEIIAVNPTGFDEIASLSIDMFKGVVDESEYVHIWKVREAEIKNLDKADFQIDGEVIPDTTEIKVICKANKFNFFAYDPEDEQLDSS